MKRLDISDELWREYEYLDVTTSYKGYHIENPVALFIKEGGTGHRIIDAEGVVHWIPVNIPHVIRWKPKNPKKPVAF